MIAILGVTALALRTVSWVGSAVTLGVGAIALSQRSDEDATDRLTWSVVVLAGCVAVAVVRLRTVLPAPRYGALAVAATIAAAVAEEAFFRRYLYSKLERFGAAVAVAVGALAFALVHLPAYGVGAMPIDLAAGALLGWQRWASGTWTAPAATHVVANLVQLW